MMNRVLTMQNGERVWVDTFNMATDDGVHFPVVGQQFMHTGAVCQSRVGNANAMLFMTREVVDFGASYFRSALE
jgi:aminoglycoside 3-N-acetyltransferase